MQPYFNLKANRPWPEPRRSNLEDITLTSAHAAAALTGILVGVAIVLSGIVVADVGPGLLGFLRYAIALLILIPFALAEGGARIEKRHLLPIALVGIGQFGLLVALTNLAVLYTSPANVALIFATLPIMSLVIERAQYHVSVDTWGDEAPTGDAVPRRLKVHAPFGCASAVSSLEIL